MLLYRDFDGSGDSRSLGAEFLVLVVELVTPIKDLVQKLFKKKEKN